MFTKPQTILRDLGDGLIMQRSTSEDAEALAEFNSKIHGADELDRQRVAAWTYDLLARPHPTGRFHDRRRNSNGADHLLYEFDSADVDV